MVAAVSWCYNQYITQPVISAAPPAARAIAQLNSCFTTGVDNSELVAAPAVGPQLVRGRSTVGFGQDNEAGGR